MKAKKSLGQNFLINDTIVNQIVSLFCVSENDLIVEIGPGRGALTQKLVTKNAQVLCVEIDTDMKRYLTKYENESCHIIYDDVLKIDIKSILSNYTYDNLYIIGNLPYYITSPILEHLIESDIGAKTMVFMVQKEVADRFSASKGSRNYGYMSLYLDFYYHVTSEIFVPRYDFNPSPKVDSAVIKLEKKDRIYNIDEDKYFQFLKQAFHLKRKTLKNNLSTYNWKDIKIILDKYNLSESVRAEEISQEIFVEIFNTLN